MAQSQNTNDDAANMSISTSDFEARKNQLLNEIQAGLEQLHINLTSFNNGLETIIDIGSQFQDTSHLWSSFHNAIAHGQGEEALGNDKSKSDSFGLDFDPSMLEPEPEERVERQQELRFEHPTMVNNDISTETTTHDND